MNTLFLGADSQISKSFNKLIETKKNHLLKKFDFEFLRHKDLRKLDNIIKKNQPKIIINTMVYHPVDLCEINQDKSLNGNFYISKKIIQIIKKIKNYTPLYIYFSSDYVYSTIDMRAKFDENTKTKPLNTLGKHKLLTEEYLAQNYHNFFIFRISWLFSEYNKNFVKTVSNLMKNNEVIEVVNDQKGNPTSAKFVAELLLKIIKNKNKNFDRGIYNFSNLPNITWYDFAKQIRKYIKKTHLKNKSIKKITLVNYNKKNNIKTIRPQNSSMKINKAMKIFQIPKKKFGWEKYLKEVIKNLN